MRFLRGLIHKELFRAAMIPLLVIELFLIVLYFSINAYVNSRTVDTLRDEVRETVLEISSREARNIDLQLSGISESARLLQKENRRFFENPDSFSLPGDRPEYGYSENGIFYKLNDDGGATVCWLDVPRVTVNEERKQRTVATECFGPLFKAVFESNPNIVAIYFNSHDSMCRYYPFQDEFYRLFSPGMIIPEFNFYYEADGNHNPERDMVWTTAYLDPARKGWMASCIVPIYRGDFLEGVTGIDITIDRFVDNILALELPWEGAAFLVDDEGMILAMPEKVENLFGLEELKHHVYETSVTADTFKPEEYNLLRNPEEELRKQLSSFFTSPEVVSEMAIGDGKYILTKHVIAETGWKLLVLVDERLAFLPITALETMARKVGFLAIGVMVLFYGAFITYLLTRTRKLSARLASPLERLSEATTDFVAREQKKDLEPAGIVEIDRLLDNFNAMTAAIVEETYRRETLLGRIALNEKRYRTLVESANAIPWEADHRVKKLIYMGRKASDLFGRPAKDWQAPAAWLEPVFAEDRKKVVDFFQEKIGATRDFDLEYRMVSSDGRVIWVHNVASLEIEEGKVVRLRGFIFDITDRILAREELHRKEEQLRQAQKMEAVGRLAGGVAHDFNNILTVIKGYADMSLLDRADRDDPVFEYLEKIDRAADKASALTRQLLSFSRKDPIQPGVLGLNEVITGMDEMVERVLGEELSLELALEPGLGNVLADPGQIEQIVVNIAVNARDAMGASGVLTVTTSNTVFSERNCPVGLEPGAYVRLTISDTGCGMDEKTLSRIFDPFFTTKERGKGTGLGLSTVFGIVKQNMGHIEVDSEEGVGTAFHVFLPRASDETADSGPAAIFRVDSLAGTERVLLVEDHMAVLDLTEEILVNNGYTVLTARDGVEGQELYEAHQGGIDLVITDVVMPRRSGSEMASGIQSLDPEMKILFISGYIDDILGEHGVLEEGVNFLSKPFTPTQILSKVRQVLSGACSDVRMGKNN